MEENGHTYDSAALPTKETPFFLWTEGSLGWPQHNSVPFAGWTNIFGAVHRYIETRFFDHSPRASIYSYAK